MPCSHAQTHSGIMVWYLIDLDILSISKWNGFVLITDGFSVGKTFQKWGGLEIEAFG